jgi:HAE1 family hydrophobic/amphiphilic exporter-1
LCVVGGLVFSQFITLYLTPVVYLYLAKVQTKIAGERPSARPGAGQPALAPAGD